MQHSSSSFWFQNFQNTWGGGTHTHTSQYIFTVPVAIKSFLCKDQDSPHHKHQFFLGTRLLGCEVAVIQYVAAFPRTQQALKVFEAIHLFRVQISLCDDVAHVDELVFEIKRRHSHACLCVLYYLHFLEECDHLVSDFDAWCLLRMSDTFLTQVPK